MPAHNNSALTTRFLNLQPDSSGILYPESILLIGQAPW